MSIQRHDGGGIPYPYLTTAAVHNGIAYISGLTADDIDRDIAGQTAATLANVERALALVGSDKSKLLRAEVWIADMADFEAMNAVYQAWLDPDNIPPRVCTQARLWHERCLVEIMVTAVVAD